MNKKVILLILVLTCSLAKAAFAQLYLEEGKVVLAVEPGERVNKSITVANTSNEEITVQGYWQDFEYQPPYDGKKSFMPEGTSPLSMSKWITLSPPVFTLQAYGKKKVEYSIVVPESAKGGYYGVMFFEKKPDPSQAKVGLSIVTRVGSLFFVETNNKSKKSEVSQIQIKDDKIKGVFTNQGDVIMIPKMSYNLFDPEGVVVDRGEIKKVYVPPGGAANWEIDLPKTVSAGEYSLVVNTDLDDGDVIVSELNIHIDNAGHLKIENS